MLLGGCVASLTVDKLQDFNPVSKVLVLDGPTRFSAKLRKELAKKGFKVLKYARNQKSEAQAPYGLTFHWVQVDRCVYNSSILIDGTFEVTDTRTNEVLLVIEKGGWTGPCLDPRGMVFEDLAQALLDNWGK